FIVPFMFFYSHELLMQGEWIDIARVVATALLGMYLLSASVQGYYFGPIGIVLRIVLLIAALSMIEGTWYTDLFGLAVAVGLFFYQKRFVTPRTLAKGAD
ncbi:MAG TPA: C4-dicarboxylate ABC transporter permease, partial [Pelagibacterium sp.]|nr:C4-dicarboxylate ABC transporter permease [Pelagibacterium sp.]